MRPELLCQEKTHLKKSNHKITRTTIISVHMITAMPMRPAAITTARSTSTSTRRRAPCSTRKAFAAA